MGEFKTMNTRYYPVIINASTIGVTNWASGARHGCFTIRKQDVMKIKNPAAYAKDVAARWEWDSELEKKLTGAIKCAQNLWRNKDESKKTT